MTNKNKTTLYIGFTNDLTRRVREHKYTANPKSFSAQYNLHSLVYFEEFENADDALRRENILKRWKRIWKDELINNSNPHWLGLAEDWK